MTGQADRTPDRTGREIAARDGEEIAYRRVVPAAAVVGELAVPDGFARIISRALHEAAMT
ncbi:MAG: hypothetical protein ACR2M3_10660 [Thermomicrobiales bacterium]